jgi:rRNA maturation endonuclease Nob1
MNVQCPRCTEIFEVRIEDEGGDCPSCGLAYAIKIEWETVEE